MFILLLLRLFSWDSFQEPSGKELSSIKLPGHQTAWIDDYLVIYQLETVRPEVWILHMEFKSLKPFEFLIKAIQ